jgi:hypothetical protein
MQLWTYHPPEFRINDHRTGPIDPSRGVYWKDSTLRYRQGLLELCKVLKINTFPLWCKTSRTWRLVDPLNPPTEWELNVPESEILCFIRESAWDGAIRHPAGDFDWDSILLTELPAPCDDVSAVVGFPLAAECLVVCHGAFVLPEWRDEVAFLKTRDKKIQRLFIDRHRSIAVDQRGTPAARALAAKRVEYLEASLA